MPTLRTKRKLAAIKKDSQEDHPKNNQTRNTNSPRIQEDYITEVSKETEGRVTEGKKKLSQVFSGTEKRILGALSRKDAIE